MGSDFVQTYKIFILPIFAFISTWAHPRWSARWRVRVRATRFLFEAPRWRTTSEHDTTLSTSGHAFVEDYKSTACARSQYAYAVHTRWVGGVDGCSQGWVVVLYDFRDGTYLARVVRTFQSVLELPEAPSTIGVDVPIGLLDSSVVGGRRCDTLARKFLGLRASSVFSAPTRAALAAHRAGGNFATVSLANRGDDLNGPRLSQQAFAILDKIGEVDAAISPVLQKIVHEVHPELSFAEANRGKPMTHSKKRSAGRAERIMLLEQLGFASSFSLLGPRLPDGVNRDDLLDACIACWTAKRIITGDAQVVPEMEERDARGLRMAIWR